MSYAPLVPFAKQLGSLAAIARATAGNQVVFDFVPTPGQRDNVVYGVCFRAAVDARTGSQDGGVRTGRKRAVDQRSQFPSTTGVVVLSDARSVFPGLLLVEFVSSLYRIGPPDTAGVGVDLCVMFGLFSSCSLLRSSVGSLLGRVFAAVSLVFGIAALALRLLAVFRSLVRAVVVQRFALVALGAGLFAYACYYGGGRWYSDGLRGA